MRLIASLVIVAVSALPDDVDDVGLAHTAAARAGQSVESLTALLARARAAATTPIAAAVAIALVRSLQDASRAIDQQARGTVRH